MAAVVPAIDKGFDRVDEVFDRMAWPVMIPKNTSTRFNHDPEVGVKCIVTLGFLSSHAVAAGCLWVA